MSLSTRTTTPAAAVSSISWKATRGSLKRTQAKARDYIMEIRRMLGDAAHRWCLKRAHQRLCLGILRIFVAENLTASRIRHGLVIANTDVMEERVGIQRRKVAIGAAGGFAEHVETGDGIGGDGGLVSLP